MEQKNLLRIVKTWKISDKPEYRGFRCASCQKYIHKAWHHQLRTGGYRTPVHFCNLCKAKLNTLRMKGVFKTFTCDNCGKKMYKSWHVWSKKGGILAEAHFCKNCGDKLGIDRKIKGVIYDLDGTIVSTTKIHEAAWLYAGEKFNVPISKEMLLNQKGVSTEAAAKMILPRNKKYLLRKFIKAKQKYVIDNINKAILFPGILKVINQLTRKGYKIWICTSALKARVEEILNIFTSLKKIKNNIIWCEMYRKGKPSPEALNLTTKKMGLAKTEVYYIGDAFSDYKTSAAAKVKFIYFCPNIRNRDKRIPKPIPIISSHKEIFKLLK